VIRLTCRLCSATITVLPTAVNQARVSHDRESHPDIARSRADVIETLLGLVHPAHTGPGGPGHCPHCGARVGAFARAAHEAAAHPAEDARLRDLVARLNSLEDHWDYLHLKGQ
jgi:hypothetical protein